MEAFLTLQNERIVLLNTLISSSKTRTKKEAAPVHGAHELLQFLSVRMRNGWAVEYYEVADADDEAVRKQRGYGHDFMRLRDMRMSEDQDFIYAVLLLEFVDVSIKSFPVVHQQTYQGRDISGNAEERGAYTIHLAVRMPRDATADDGTYRCAIENIREISRKDIETFLCRQLRRYAQAIDLSFTVTQPPSGKRKKAIVNEYRYTPKLELVANVGRSLGAMLGAGKELSQMVFTKRRERQSTAQATVVDHEDFVADIEYRVTASQGPADPAERLSWIGHIKDYFEHIGYETKLYYRHLNGRTISGDVHKDLASATDLLMCPKEFISLSTVPRVWNETIDSEISSKLREILDRDAIWQVSE